MKKNLLIITILTLIMTGCGKNNDDEHHPIVEGIKTQIVAKTMVDDFYQTSATVKPKTSSVVSSMIMGRVTGLNVQEGDYVAKGQVLLTIDSRDTAQRALGAKAGVNEASKGAEQANQARQMANKTYQRYKKLYDEKVITRQEFDIISTQKNVAELEYQRTMAGVSRAQAGLGEVNVYQSYAKVTSPISGFVVQRNIDLGSTAVQGQPLFVIEAPSNLELVAEVNESLLPFIKVGTPVTLESEDAVLKSKITAVVPKINSMTRTFKVKVALSELNSGQYVKVKIPVAKKEVIVVPIDAIVQKGQLTGVYTVDEQNIISYRLIRKGEANGNNVEILSGLSVGDKVIISGVDKAVDGGEVK